MNVRCVDVNKLKRKRKIRRVCRKCGYRLTTKEGYVLCPSCGWVKGRLEDNEQKIPTEQTD